MKHTNALSEQNVEFLFHIEISKHTVRVNFLAFSLRVCEERSGGSHNAVRVRRCFLRFEGKHSLLMSVETLQSTESTFAVWWVPAAPYRVAYHSRAMEFGAPDADRSYHCALKN